MKPLLGVLDEGSRGIEMFQLGAMKRREALAFFGSPVAEAAMSKPSTLHAQSTTATDLYASVFEGWTCGQGL